MNTFKKTGGFTLVELIIVIAILAILSAVAVAGYSSYIKRANDSAVLSELNNISTAATLANAQAAGIEKITVNAKGQITVYAKDNMFDEPTNGDGFVALFRASTNITLSKVTVGTGATARTVYQSNEGAFEVAKLAKSKFVKGAEWTGTWEEVTA